MHKILLRVSTSEPTARQIYAVRGVCGLPIGEIKDLAKDGRPVAEFVIFSGRWREHKQTVQGVIHGIEAGELPLEIYEWSAPQGFEPQERPLTPEEARDLMAHLHGIELETQMMTQLETGEISDPDEFEPYDEDA